MKSVLTTWELCERERRWIEFHVSQQNHGDPLAASPLTDENEARGVKARVGVELGQVSHSRCHSADAEITRIWGQNTHSACVTELLLWNLWGLAVVKAFATQHFGAYNPLKLLLRSYIMFI